jgi:Flp pilus assembly secretin CpaC
MPPPNTAEASAGAAPSVCELFTIPRNTPFALQFRVPGSTMSFRFRSAAAFVAAMLTAGPVLAQSAAPVIVKVNMARILRISAPASTVIIGNPGIADVTIQDPQTLVLTGKSFGQTNLIVLDSAGEPIADTMLEVVQDQVGLVTVYYGLSRTSVSCEPVCQPIIMLGDEPSYSSQVISSAQSIEGAAN